MSESNAACPNLIEGQLKRSLWETFFKHPRMILVVALSFVSVAYGYLSGVALVKAQDAGIACLAISQELAAEAGPFTDAIKDHEKIMDEFLLTYTNPRDIGYLAVLINPDLDLRTTFAPAISNLKRDVKNASTEEGKKAAFRKAAAAILKPYERFSADVGNLPSITKRFSKPRSDLLHLIRVNNAALARVSSSLLDDKSRGFDERIDQCEKACRVSRAAWAMLAFAWRESASNVPEISDALVAFVSNEEIVLEFTKSLHDDLVAQHDGRGSLIAHFRDSMNRRIELLNHMQRGELALFITKSVEYSNHEAVIQ